MLLRERNRVAEWMDQPDLCPRLHAQALAGLRRINAWSGTARQVWRGIARIAQERKLSRLRILDVACGGGELVQALARRAHESHFYADVHGCDLSPTAVELAWAAAGRIAGNRCHFFTHDAVRNPLPSGYDIVISTLFLHHLEEDEAVALLKNMAQATDQAIIVDDLIRSRTGYWLAWVGCRLLTRSPVVHFDGPVSVAAAFRLDEVKELCAEAGLTGANIRTHWPERFLLSWEKPR
jgi:2-polyprenyl-3-methyl-5-hydroxy-6-metoxy-1,4-benzoquinol methylase